MIGRELGDYAIALCAVGVMVVGLCAQRASAIAIGQADQSLTATITQLEGDMTIFAGQQSGATMQGDASASVDFTTADQADMQVGDQVTVVTSATASFDAPPPGFTNSRADAEAILFIEHVKQIDTNPDLSATIAPLAAQISFDWSVSASAMIDDPLFETASAFEIIIVQVRVLDLNFNEIAFISDEQLSGFNPLASSQTANVESDSDSETNRIIDLSIEPDTIVEVTFDLAAVANAEDTLIPEPATLALLGCGIGAMLRRRRREDD